jgi:imidazolonepropionase
MRKICDVWLPALHAEGLVDSVDVFCESIGFDLTQSERLFDTAARLGIPVKMHAEQLSNIGGTRMATHHHALSCDHLEYATAEDAAALAAAGTVAVLLPVAFYCLAASRKPPIQELRDAGAKMAVASDCNPGSAPGTSLLLAMSMATRLFGLTAEEALAGVTRHAAQALGEADLRGTLAAGRAADFVIWNIVTLEELGYWIGFNPRRSLVRAGRICS